jgi:peptide/nickel transport system permease protein
MPDQSFSFSNQSWKRLKKNKGALVGVGIITAAILISIFCYLIDTDNTPNADFQTVEIQAKSPGFKQLFLKIVKWRF